MTRHLSYFTILFPVGSPIGIWKYVDTEVDHKFIGFWTFLSDPGDKHEKMDLCIFLFRIFTPEKDDLETTTKSLKIFPDCNLFYLEFVWLFLPTIKSIGQNFFQKIPFFVNSKLWTLLDFGMMSGQNIQTQNKTQSKDWFKDLEEIPGSIHF